jgi:tRNA A37 N6-isopentenylltransferase MiaA
MYNTLKYTAISFLKTDDMPELKLKQLQYESDTWKRLLVFMQEENVHLKNRLSEVLKDKFNNNLLEEVEVYQANFLKEDELISFLRNEVAEIDSELVKDIFVDGKLNKKLEKKFNLLRKNLTSAEKRFDKMKLAFKNYLAQNI